jgi:hypothetical protein
MDRATAFAELAQVTQELTELKSKIVVVLEREKELYAFLNLPHPDDKPEKPARKRITKEQAIEIRRKIIPVMHSLCGKGLTWLPMQLIVKRVNQELPNALESEIETQIRFLAQSESAPVQHNGQRGNGSAYTYAGK